LPEGFEALGAENLRDILAFVCGDDAKYRIIDLRPAFTPTVQGNLHQPGGGAGVARVQKIRIDQGCEVPFEIMAPPKTRAGKT